MGRDLWIKADTHRRHVGSDGPATTRAPKGLCFPRFLWRLLGRADHRSQQILAESAFMSAPDSTTPRLTTADHPQRLALHHEIHARPPVPLWSNERIISQAFTLNPISRNEHTTWIDRASAAFPPLQKSLQQQSIRVLQLATDPGRILLKWEMHGEFVAITLIGQQESPEQFETRAALLARANSLLERKAVPPLSELTGQRLVAIDICLEQAEFYPDAFEVAKRFNDNTVVGSTITTNRNAQLWTDLQLDEDGFVRMVVRGKAMGSRQAGRAIQRLIDIETYRMMALLAFPSAKSLAEPLRNAELELAKVSEKIATAQQQTTIDITVDAQLLGDVSALAARVEGWISANGLRFTAAEAYHELVKGALQELNEDVIPGVQMLGTFMERRFEPAMRTCRWTVRRLHDLSDRISRTSHILKTRIEFVNESQQQALLASMDRRAKLQLRLQQTVEGLSVIVMTYYSTGLLQYIAKGLKVNGAPVDPDTVGLFSVPLIAAGLLWFMTRRRKKQPLL
ncbi:MAG: DUF3422 domain-containing protein [Burkholderiaceae bacterium]|nr:DUF3422 domain-containing protein [Burkholderiaceae bacterium]